MSTDVQGMLVRIEATTQQLRQELARAESAVGKATKQIDGNLARVDAAFDRVEQSAGDARAVVDSALSGIAASAVAGVAGIGALVSITAAAGKELTSLSFLANASTAEFQRMAAGARSAGVDQGKLADVLKDVNDRVGEFASTGGGEMKDFFEQIAPKVGVTVQQFQKLSGPQALQLYYDSLEKAGLNQQEMTFYMEAMADEATALIPLLANGGKGFQEMGDRAERLGVVLSDLELSQLAELSKIAGDASAAWDGFTGQLVAGLHPAISALVESLDGEGFSEAAQNMGDGIRFVIDNLDALAIAVGSLGAGKLAIRFVEGVQAVAGYAQAVRAAAVAERENAQAMKASALERVQLAEAERLAARVQVIATSGTKEQRVALNQLRQAKREVTAANAAYAAAQAASNTVTGSATALLRGALSLFGGPVGLVTMIGTAAAGWLLFSKNSDQANRSTIDLTKSVEEQRKEIEALNLAQANARLNNLQDEQRRWRDELAATTRTLEGQVGAFDKWGGNFSASQRERAAAWQEFTAALNRGEDVGQAAARLADMTGASEEMRTKIENAAAQLDVQRNSVEQNAAAQAMLEGHMRSLTGATHENTIATGENTGSKGGNTDAAQKYLEQLQKQLNAMRDKTALQAAERFLTENSITAESELGQQILATAKAKDRQREADTAATAARKSSTKAVKDEAKELQSLLDKLLPAEAAQREHVEAVKLLDQALLSGQKTLDGSIFGLEEYTRAMSAAWAAQNKAEWDKANKAQEELNKTLKASNDAFEQLEDQLDPVRAASKRLAEQQKILRAEYDRGEISLERYNALLGRAQVEYDGVAKEASAWVKLTADAFERVNAAGADMWYEFFDTGRVTFDSLLGIGKRWAAEMANALTMRGLTAVFGGMLGMGGSSSAFASLGGALGGGGGGGGLLDIFNAGKTAYGVGTSGFGQAIAAGWNGGQGFFGGLQGAASGAWNYGSNALGGLFGGGTAGSSIADYTGAAFSNWAAGGSQALGASQAGYTGAQFSNWVALQNAGNWGMAATSLGSILGGVGGALYGYGQSGWKGAATGALGGWGGATLGSVGGAALGTAIGGTLGSVVPVIGTAIGAALGSWLGGSLFSGDWQTKDAGLAFSVADGDFLGQQFEYQKKKGGLFSSNKKRFVYSELDEESAEAFQSAFDSVELGVTDLFERLSFTVEDGALAGLQLAETRISTAGKTEEEIQQAIAEWFGGVGEAMNAELNRVFSTGLDYDLAGMTAFVNNLYAVNEVIRYLNIDMYETDVAGGKLAEQLSALAGGFDALQASAGVYYEQFFSDAEKAWNTVDAVTRAFQSAGQILPNTREKFRAMVEAIDMTGAAGQQMFATLMQLAGQADAYYDIIEAQGDRVEQALMGNVSSAFGLLQRSIAAEKAAITEAYNAQVGSLSDMIATATESGKSLESVSNSLLSALRKLRGGSTEAVKSLRAQATETLKLALGAAKSGGDLSSIPGLEDALDIASEVDPELYASLSDFQREQGRTANLVASLNGLAEDQLSDAQKTLATLKSQLTLAQEAYNTQMRGLDAYLESAQREIDAINGVDNSVKSVAEAVTALNGAIAGLAAYRPAPPIAGGGAGGGGGGGGAAGLGSTIEAIYQAALGRDPDPGGLAFWANEVASGVVSVDQLAGAIIADAVRNGEIAGFSSGGYTGPGGKYQPAGVAHAGEVIWSQDDVARWGGWQTVDMLRKSSMESLRGPELYVARPTQGEASGSSGQHSVAAAISGLQDGIRAIAKHTMQTAKRAEAIERFLDGWEADGLPKERIA